ncbi:class I SAM-dependent methyltransferase [Candidatus Micrarchaeota archaeon]|nr:class I SAM-dependent methyltransferase [Candidatus Micrarchaeota archaeon]
MANAMEHVKCNLCGADDYRVVYAAVDKVSAKGEGGYSAASTELLTDQVVQCNKCGLIYLDPRPKSEKVVDDYSNAVDEKYVSQSKGRLRTFEKCAEFVEKYSKKGKILDVGAAAGFFVHTAQKRGWQAEGIEPSKWMVEWGKNNLKANLRAGTLEKAKYPADYFDVVTYWDVLEHVPDPMASLKEANRILKKGGLVVVNYPDIASNLAKAAGRKWWFLLSVHLYYFTPDSISKMLEAAGFEVVKTKRHWQKLSLGYLVERVKPYNKLLYKVADKFVKALNIGDRQITYYLSQRLVLARKK